MDPRYATHPAEPDELVCVGGPLDGQRVRTSQDRLAAENAPRRSLDTISLAVPRIEIVIYERETWRDQAGDVAMLRPTNQSFSDTMRLLFDGYRRPSVPDFASGLTAADLDRIEALALAAGGDTARWRAGDHAMDEGAVYDEAGDNVVYDESAPSAEQAKHIASVDPATVLKLIALARKGLDR